jgi:hypothetical protein
MFELENRPNEIEDEQEKNILFHLLERYYWKIYNMKADYNLWLKKYSGFAKNKILTCMLKCLTSK